MGAAGGQRGDVRRGLGLASIVAVVGIGTMAAVGVIADNDPDPMPGEVREVPFRSPTSSTTTTRPSTTTTTIPAERVDIGALPGGYTRVVTAGGDLLVTTADGSLPFGRLREAGASIAFGAGEGLVAYQEWGDESYGSGRIVILDRRAEHVAFGPGAPHESLSHQLHDVGYVGGRPYALVTWSSGGARPSHLRVTAVLIDLTTLEQLDLGVVGGGEDWIGGARLLPNGDVLVLRTRLEAEELELRRLDGSSAWTVPLGREAPPRTLVLGPAIGDPLVLEPSPHDSDFATLRVRRFELATGAEQPALFDGRLQLGDGLAFSSGHCSSAELDHGDLLCDQPGGPTVRVEVATGRTHPERGAPPRGRMTLWRFAP